MRCERCKVETKGYELHDYCAKCSKNLCAKCMANGCCGSKPATSGMQDEADPVPAAGIAWPGTGWQVVRDGSRIAVVRDGEQRHEISIEQAEDIAVGMAKMVRDAKHWKEQGE